MLMVVNMEGCLQILRNNMQTFWTFSIMWNVFNLERIKSQTSSGISNQLGILLFLSLFLFLFLLLFSRLRFVDAVDGESSRNLGLGFGREEETKTMAEGGVSTVERFCEGMFCLYDEEDDLYDYTLDSLYCAR